MFEFVLLLFLLGIVVWFLLAKGDSSSPRRSSFINLAAELKPVSKSRKKRHV